MPPCQSVPRRSTASDEQTQPRRRRVRRSDVAEECPPQPPPPLRRPCARSAADSGSRVDGPGGCEILSHVRQKGRRMEFYNMKLKRKVDVPDGQIKKTVFQQKGSARASQRRYALTAEHDG